VGGAAVGEHGGAAPNAGSAGVSTNGGNGGTGGTGGSNMGVLNPNLPTPSHDCRTDTGHANCISIAGTFAGTPIDEFCNNPNDLSVIVHSGEWVIGCDHLMPGFARLYIPIKKPSTLSETASKGQKAQMEFEYGDDAASLSLDTANFVSAELGGSIALDQYPGYRIVSGTFHGTWTKPDSACLAFYSLPCAAADINVTFRINSEYGTCFDNSECTAPLVCTPGAYRCYSP
jgi:hypothetical protein